MAKQKQPPGDPIAGQHAQARGAAANNQETKMTKGARIFISCGQQKDSDEVVIATAIANRLGKLGYEPYVAVAEQSLRGLKDNIFKRLQESEYFVFVDFKREILEGTSRHRGSLFSHQELAIAAFLEIPVIAFQENGVKSDDGIISVLQANAVPFTDRHNLTDIIDAKVRDRGWTPGWRNELALERASGELIDARVTGRRLARYFHIRVRNIHREKTATNCYVYLERAVRLPAKTEIPLKTVEFKWAGSTLPAVAIAAGSFREFDALVCFHDNPAKAEFAAHSDSSDFIPKIKGTGQYELSYLVISENFTHARGTFTLTLSQNLNEINLSPA
jgi:hypothetical protein